MIFTLSSVSRAAVKMELFRQLVDGAALAVYVRGTFKDRSGELVFIRDWRDVRAITGNRIEIEVDGSMIAVQPLSLFDLSIDAASTIA